MTVPDFRLIYLDSGEPASGLEPLISSHYEVQSGVAEDRTGQQIPNSQAGFFTLPCIVLRSQWCQVLRRVYWLLLYPGPERLSATQVFLQCIGNSLVETQPPPVSLRRIPRWLRQP